MQVSLRQTRLRLDFLVRTMQVLGGKSHALSYRPRDPGAIDRKFHPFQIEDVDLFARNRAVIGFCK